MSPHLVENLALHGQRTTGCRAMGVDACRRRDAVQPGAKAWLPTGALKMQEHLENQMAGQYNVYYPDKLRHGDADRYA